MSIPKKPSLNIQEKETNRNGIPEGAVRLVTNFDARLHSDLKEYAFFQKTSIRELLEEAARDLLIKKNAKR